ncbi:AraC family transcriptional regulator [Sphingomonas sp. LHG3406-1]|uniref:AraC family transcriptional regulator n=1 Tax=Sphingomonas sp. LHG3406-1 TaxID=2804617 RepID=UPI00262D5007|nr:AraC family transcriptional regulator [Sphingomonas sp. LHG3406-1]
MDVAGIINLEPGGKHDIPVHRVPLAMRGFRVEHVVLDSSDGYEFKNVGATHYLALHDLALEDGELRVDGLREVRERDIRGTLTYVPEGLGISGWAKPVDRRNSFTTLHFEPAEFSDDLGQRFGAIEAVPLIYDRDPSLVQTMAKLRKLAQSVDPDLLYAETLCVSAALEILGAVGAPRPGRLSAQQIRRLTQFVEAGMAGRLTLDDLAGVTGLSRSHFSRTFTASFGRGPHQFVQERRIARAEDLLRHSDKHPDEIASLAGFGSPASFRRNFKQATGLSPSAYRKAK